LGHRHRHAKEPDEEFVQTYSTYRDVDNEDGDRFMAESIAEAEAEIKAHKNGANVVTESLIRAEEAQESKDDLSALDSTSAKSIKQMTEELIDGALTTKSVVSYNGGEVDVKNFSDDGSEEIR
jgi:hypothetical protein